MVKINRKYKALLFALLMSSSTAFIVSAAITYIHHAPASAFIAIWLTSFITAWPIVFIAILAVAPKINKIVEMLTSE